LNCLLRAANPHLKFLECCDDIRDCFDHSSDPIPEGIVVGTSWRNLVNRYVNEEVGVCLHIHVRTPSLYFEVGDFAFIFQKAGLNRIHVDEGSSFGNSDLGIDVRSPRHNNVQSSMPVNPRPIVEDSKVAVEIAKQQPRVIEFRSVVRLYRLDNGPTLRREWLNLPSVLLEVLYQGTDRKFQTSLIGGDLPPEISTSGSWSSLVN
jgi:hypothetical protein